MKHGLNTDERIATEITEDTEEWEAKWIRGKLPAKPNKELYR
jgi:hypothetical protein